MKRLYTSLIAFTTALCLGLTLINLPQLHKHYMRSAVGPSVVKIVKLGDEGQVLGGGTGFEIEYKKNSYIMTNAHVCDMYQGKKDANILMPNGELRKREILKISDETDLCLISGIKELPSLHLGNSAHLGEIISVVGHPRLLPLNVADGDILGIDTVDVGVGIIGIDVKAEDCMKPKNKTIELKTFFGDLTLCTEEVRAYQTTAEIFPGNSGSPVVNTYGNVVGVAFASDNETHYALVIPLEEVQDFLSTP